MWVGNHHRQSRAAPKHDTTVIIDAGVIFLYPPSRPPPPQARSLVQQLPTTCLIGAGSSGIAVVKALKQHRIPFDCFEKSDQIGGNWVIGNKNGMSAAYRDLFINVSRERMQYSDFPMSKAYPDFPHHTQIAEYFNAYVDRFGLREDITFETGVEHAALTDDRTWE